MVSSYFCFGQQRVVVFTTKHAIVDYSFWQQVSVVQCAVNLHVCHQLANEVTSALEKQSILNVLVSCTSALVKQAMLNVLVS